MSSRVIFHIKYPCHFGAKKNKKTSGTEVNNTVTSFQGSQELIQMISTWQNLMILTSILHAENELVTVGC